MARSLRKRLTLHSVHMTMIIEYTECTVCLYFLYTHWSLESWCHYPRCPGLLWLFTVHPLDTRLGLAWSRHGLVARCIAGPGKWITGCHFGCLPSAMMTSSDTWERKSWLWLQSKMGSAMIGIGQELWQGWGRWEGEGRHDQAQDWREACIYWSFKSRDGSILEYLLNRI